MIIELKLNWSSTEDDRAALLAALEKFQIIDLGPSHLASSRRYEIDATNYKSFVAAAEDLDAIDCVRFISGPSELRPHYPR